MSTLVVGSGFVGRAVAARLLRTGEKAVLASRTPPPENDGPPPPWSPLDVTDPDAVRRTLDTTDAERIVLVHGPSDVTWIEARPEAAMRAHAGAARTVLDAAGERRIVFISTDNVFDGTVEAPDETTPPRPANAYGRAKLAAERILAEGPATTVLRVSLVYGWEPPETTKWLNYFSSCVHRLRAGERVTAPSDQWTTPVLVEDVAAVTTAVLAASGAPLLHLGGPERISRADWARLIARESGLPPDRVVAEPRAHGRYASRPANTCLAAPLLATHPATAGVPVRGVRDGTRLLLGRAAPPEAP
ncbi:sugar nucleotide-binding protein [Streptomyces sp. NBC_01478]|uniref:SDR family oxidoreductase n=1 Tax=Streptomyces sp. NBC_01478 TaxID=2903882 RepID=UPI002E3067CD|nr:sugar nucleotide-binding protein [Streptomyces sp. NBC_01478]